MKKEKVFRMPYLTNLAEAKELAASVEAMATEFAAEQPGRIWMGYSPRWGDAEKIAIITKRCGEIMDCDFVDRSLSGAAVREWVLSIALESCINPFALAEESEGKFVDMHFKIEDDEIYIADGMCISSGCSIVDPNDMKEFCGAYSEALIIRPCRPEGIRYGQQEKKLLQEIADAQANRHKVVKETTPSGESYYHYKDQPIRDLSELFS